MNTDGSKAKSSKITRAKASKEQHERRLDAEQLQRQRKEQEMESLLVDDVASRLGLSKVGLKDMTEKYEVSSQAEDAFKKLEDERRERHFTDYKFGDKIYDDDRENYLDDWFITDDVLNAVNKGLKKRYNLGIIFNVFYTITGLRHMKNLLTSISPKNKANRAIDRFLDVYKDHGHNNIFSNLVDFYKYCLDFAKIDSLMTEDEIYAIVLAYVERKKLGRKCAVNKGILLEFYKENFG